MDLALVSVSDFEPVSLQEAKVFMGVHPDFTQDDQLIAALVRAGRERAENFCNRSFVDKEYDLLLDKWPNNYYRTIYRAVKLTRGPVKSITHVKYLDNDGDEQTMPDTQYELSKGKDPALIFFFSSLPSLHSAPEVVRIRYSCGYDPTGGDYINPLPDTVRTAILMSARTMYDRRDDIIHGTIVNEIPQTARFLLRDYRIFEFM